MIDRLVQYVKDGGELDHVPQINKEKGAGLTDKEVEGLKAVLEK